LTFRQASPFHKGVLSAKAMLHGFQAMLSPANIKLKIAEMQQMSFPELVIGFFKMFFYIFYYSGFGVATVLKYFTGMLMSLMRGPQVEEPVVDTKEEEKIGKKRHLPAAPEEPAGQIALADAPKEE
jgi:ryanodine receptor 2